MTEIEQLRQNFEKLKPKHKYEKKFKATYDYRLNSPRIHRILLCINIFALCISLAILPDKLLYMAKILFIISLILILVVPLSIYYYRYANINNSSKNIIGYGKSSIIDILFIICQDSSYKSHKFELNDFDPLSDWIITDIFMKYVVETPETIRLLNLNQLPNNIKSDLIYNILKDLNKILDELIELNHKSLKNDKISISNSSIQKSMAELNNLK